MWPDQIEHLGRGLADCRKWGTVVELGLDLMRSDEEAEAVQTAAMEAYGGDPCGYSVQATTPLNAAPARLFRPDLRPLAGR